MQNRVTAFLWRVLRECSRGFNRWGLLATLILLLILTPIVAVLVQTYQGGGGDTWQHLANTVLQDYITNSLLLAIGVGILSLVFGLSTAWLVSTCNFPARKFFTWALLLPMAIPTYIAAYTYAGIFDYVGPVQVFFRNTLDWQVEPSWFNIMHFRGLMVIMALVLYPYVYAITRTAFLSQSRTILESSRVLGSSAWRTFFRIALPVNRPAIVGGLLLVVMEVLNDYGAVKYFGVTTFTTGIFRAWFSLGDSNAAAYLSAILMFFVFAVILIERWQRGRASYDAGDTGSKPIRLYQLTSWQKILAFMACLIPFLFGFAIPVIQLLSWSIDTAPQVVDWDFGLMVGNSFVLAAGSSILCVIAATLLLYSVKINRNMVLQSLSKLAVLGYSIPGAVIAIGVLIPLLLIDKKLLGGLANIWGLQIDLILTGSVFALIYAYVVRFLAVAYNSVYSGFKKIGDSLDEGSRILGVPPMKTFFKINFPLMKGAILSGALLVFVDVLKELPLTLILRPFNFETLATQTFALASDELVAQSANSALIIILTGLVPILVLNQLIAKEGMNEHING